jgi:hypothetical protein
MAYVSAYGNYGGERVLVFDYTDLSVKQWDTLAELGDGDRLSYVDAILSNEPLDRWED